MMKLHTTSIKESWDYTENRIAVCDGQGRKISQLSAINLQDPTNRSRDHLRPALAKTSS